MKGSAGSYSPNLYFFINHRLTAFGGKFTIIRNFDEGGGEAWATAFDVRQKKIFREVGQAP
jgi:hypothetical protein